jgi:hypothetical protein
MAGGKLSVEIGADITDFEKKIKEVEFDIKELSKVKLDRLKVGLDTSEINAQIKDAKNNLKSLQTTVKDTGGSFASMTPRVANAGNTLTQFSRIAQDAPFGIIGIGNNITATAEAFGYLKAQTGSTGGALKALGQSLAGTGGILLGVSLLTTGLTLLAQSGLSVGDVIDKLTGNFDEFGASIKKAREEGANMASKEIESMRALISVAQNDNLTKQQRLVAVDKLQKQFGSYYANLSAEKIMYGDLTKETNDATKALIARAVAEKLSEKGASVFAERLKANGKYLELSQKLEKFDEDIQRKRERVAKKQEGVFGLTEDIIRKQESARKNILDDINDERNKIISLTNAYEKYTNIIDKLNEKAAPLTDESKKGAKSFNTPQVSGIGSNLIPAPLFDPKGIATFNGQVDEFGNKIKSLPGVIQSSLVQIPVLVDQALVQYTAIMQQFTSQLNELIQSAVPDAIANLGNALGTALANGTDVVSALGTSLLQSLGSFISELGRMLIQYGLLLVGFGKAQLAFQVGDPVTKIGAGIAMIALGVAATAAGAAIGSFASGNGRGGGRASNSTGSGANNQSFSSSGFSSRSDTSGTVVFEIAGQKLIGVLSNTINANRRLGGALGIG